jgi:exosortase/archaeosortase family protein
MNVAPFLAQPPPPTAPLIPTGSELLLAALLALTGGWILWKRGRPRAAIVFASVFCGLTALGYLAIPENSAVQEKVTRVLIHGFSWGPALLLSMLGTPASVAGVDLVTADGAWTVVRGCLGLSYLGMFLLASLTYPGSWGRRSVGLLLGTVLFVLLNQLRVVMLYELWQAEFYVAFELLHRGSGFYFTVVLVALWLLTIGRRPASAEEAEAPAPASEPRSRRIRARLIRRLAVASFLVGLVWSGFCYGQMFKHLSWMNGWRRAAAARHSDATPEVVAAAVANNQNLASGWAGDGVPGLVLLLAGGTAVLLTFRPGPRALWVSSRYRVPPPVPAADPPTSA